MSKTVIVTKYLGIQYKNMGRDLTGLDCWGLVMALYKDILNIELPDTIDNYGIDWSWKGKDYFKENYTDKWFRVEKAESMDIALFKNSKGIANHAGVMLNSKDFIQCTKAGVNLSKITHKKVAERLVGIFRYKND